MLSSKSFYVIGTLALLFVSSVFADDVFVLTESNFDKEVGQDRGALVEFYAPWCEHCKKLALEYEKLGASFKKAKSVLIGKVDCDEHKSLCSKYGVSGYPTIQWFPKGFLEPKKYEGACGAEALAEFLNKERKIPVSTKYSQTLEDPATELAPPMSRPTIGVQPSPPAVVGSSPYPHSGMTEVVDLGSASPPPVLAEIRGKLDGYEPPRGSRESLDTIVVRMLVLDRVEQALQ